MMAQAFDHLKPLVRLNHFIYARSHEMKEESEHIEAELRMWAEPTLQGYARVAEEMVGDRKTNLSNRLLFLNVELTEWNRMDSVLDKCTACDGNGETTYYEDPQDGARF